MEYVKATYEACRLSSGRIWLDLMEAILIEAFEKELGLTLPADYKATLLDYPFAGEHTGTEMLVNDLSLLRSWNLPARPQGKKRAKKTDPREGYFMIGSDCSETVFFIDPKRKSSPVWYYEMETGKFELYVASIREYLDKCAKIDAGEELYPNEASNIPEWLKTIYAIAIFLGFILFGWLVYKLVVWFQIKMGVL